MIGSKPIVLKIKIQINRQISHCFHALNNAIHFRTNSQAIRKANNGNIDFNITIFDIISIFMPLEIKTNE